MLTVSDTEVSFSEVPVAEVSDTTDAGVAGVSLSAQAESAMADTNTNDIAIPFFIDYSPQTDIFVCIIPNAFFFRHIKSAEGCTLGAGCNITILSS